MVCQDGACDKYSTSALGNRGLTKTSAKGTWSLGKMYDTVTASDEPGPHDTTAAGSVSESCGWYVVELGYGSEA